MKVIKISPRGYCGGVKKAINTVKKLANNENNKPIYLMGHLVHNTIVCDELKQLGVIVLEDEDKLKALDKIEKGTVVFSAHGIADSIYNKALEKGLNAVKTTCLFVEKTDEIMKNYSSQNYTIFYIGIKNHPESINALLDKENTYLITNENDIPLNIKGDILVTNQTTLNFKNLYSLHKKIKELYPNVLIMNELCNQTRLRQEALIEYNKNVDLCIIVGDMLSNNTKSLKQISEEFTKTKTIIVDSLKSLDKSLLSCEMTVSITSGASTPNELTNEIINYLEKL